MSVSQRRVFWVGELSCLNLSARTLLSRDQSRSSAKQAFCLHLQDSSRGASFKWCLTLNFLCMLDRIRHLLLKMMLNITVLSSHSCSGNKDVLLFLKPPPRKTANSFCFFLGCLERELGHHLLRPPLWFFFFSFLKSGLVEGQPCVTQSELQLGNPDSWSSLFCYVICLKKMTWWDWPMPCLKDCSRLSIKWIHAPSTSYGVQKSGVKGTHWELPLRLTEVLWLPWMLSRSVKSFISTRDSVEYLPSIVNTSSYFPLCICILFFLLKPFLFEKKFKSESGWVKVLRLALVLMLNTNTLGNK